MDDTVRVDDASDPRLAPYRSLTDAALRRQIESDERLFIVEGVTAIRRLLTSAYPVHSVLLTPAKYAQVAQELAGVDAPVLVAPLEVMSEVTGFDIHRGAVAAAERLPQLAIADLVETAHTLVVLEGLNDHENIGAIARTARALGADGLLFDPSCADPLYRRSVRVSMGEILHLPLGRVEPWPEGLDLLRAAGIAVIALTPEPEAEVLDDLATERPARLALLLGAEGKGLTPAALAAADRRVRIRQRHEVDSLNVGHACAIALHRLGFHAEG
jgi:tRNA G18 (ribose-2'-O)-methylase SpoU